MDFVTEKERRRRSSKTKKGPNAVQRKQPGSPKSVKSDHSKEGLLVCEACKCKLSKTSIVYEAASSPSPPLPRSSSSSSWLDSSEDEEWKEQQQLRAEKRAKLMQELLTSEETHVEALKGVMVDYKRPLESMKIFSQQQLKNLFGNIDLILTWNMDFLASLRTTLSNGQSGCFGDIVKKMCLILRQLFTAYNENYQLAQETYTECLKNPEFELFVKNRSNQKDSKTNLLTSLYLPIQRMIMYQSLLKDIARLTPRNHKDYDDLWMAYQQLRFIDKAANRVAEKRKNLDTVIKIQNSLIGEDCEIAAPHRSYVFEEELTLVVGKSHKEKTLYLFNDMLLLTKMKKKKYEVERRILLINCTVDEKEDDRFLFSLTTPDGEEFLFSSHDKRSWIQILSSTMKKLHSSAILNDLLEGDQEGVFANQESDDFLTKRMLMKKIVKWSESKNPEQVMREIRKMSKRIERSEQGDLSE
eukprot:TRINITY_DN1037_c0_g3_i1.p1 TRINITY_DN1037_c0_g3~~TRINITY_DN1037_c0_g3_i1.p1  ORF type:complete len:470 (+),score=91.03 TRINITY_DN1037_c0_g3_i1:62-1471(+)